jgi:nitrate/nitrite transport system substrate-binding protein
MSNMSKLTRRNFLITAGAATAATVFTHGCTSSSTTSNGGSSASGASPSPVANGDVPETSKATLGFIALTDCAALAVAKEKGLFDKYGMTEVNIAKQTSWAVTRDNLELGSTNGGIDGGHILSPMPYLISAGKTKSNKPLPMYILARLNVNGQGISLANTYKDLNLTADSSPLKAKVEELKAAGKKFKCAVTFPGGTHDLWMRYWLAAGGIDPTQDVDIVVIPPPQMVANMESNTMDAFCVGEPWNGRLVTKQSGFNAVTTGEIWKDHPEKAFTLRADWVDKNPKAAKALLMAVQEAQIWCDDPANKQEMCEILAKDKYVKAPVKDILERAKGNFDFGAGRTLENSKLLMKFWNDSASFPFKSHDAWFLTEDIRWGVLPAETDVTKLVDSVNRSDLWKEAAKAIGQEAAIPKKDTRGVETFFDGIKFDSDKPEDYLKTVKIKKV